MARTSTVGPNEVARDLSRRLGRPITAKMVRSVARATLGAYNKAEHPEYQSHAYDPAAVRRISAVFEARGQRSRAQTRKATPRKATAKRPRSTRPAAPATAPDATDA